VCVTLTTRSPVAPLEHDVQRRRLTFLINNLAVTTPVDKIDLPQPNEITVAVVVKHTHASNVVNGALARQRAAAQAAVVSVYGPQPDMVPAQLTVDSLQRLNRILVCFEHVPDSQIRKPVEQLFEIFELPPLMHFIHYRLKFNFEATYHVLVGHPPPPAETPAFTAHRR
jgi:hypothetical protein